MSGAARRGLDPRELGLGSLGAVAAGAALLCAPARQLSAAAVALAAAAPLAWAWFSARGRATPVPPLTALASCAAAASLASTPAGLWGVPLIGVAVLALLRASFLQGAGSPAASRLERAALAAGWAASAIVVARGGEARAPLAAALLLVLVEALAVGGRFTAEAVARRALLVLLVGAMALAQGYRERDGPVVLGDLLAVVVLAAAAALVRTRLLGLARSVPRLLSRYRAQAALEEPAPALDASRARAWSLLIGLAFVAHGLLLPLRFRSDDDWAYLDLYQRGDIDHLCWANDIGNNALMNLYNVPFAAFPDPQLAFRWASLGAIVVAALAVRELLLEAGFCARDALYTALLFVVYPAYMAHMILSLNAFWAALAVYLVGWWLTLRSERCPGSRGTVLRVVAAALVFWCFVCGSLLVFHLSFVLLHVAVVARQRGVDLRGAARFYALHRWPFLALPVAHWAFKAVYRSTHPTLLHYNVVELQPELIPGLVASFGRVMGHQLGLVLSSVGFAATLVLMLVVSRQLRSTRTDRASAERYPAAVAFGLLSLALGIAPYVLVRKWPQDADSFETRTLLLAGAPIALILVAGSGLLRVLTGAPERLRMALVAALIAGSTATRIESYLRFHGREAETRSFLMHLAALPAARDVRVFGVTTTLDSIDRSITHRLCWVIALQEALGGGPERIALRRQLDSAAAGPIPRTRIALEMFDYQMRVWNVRIDPHGRQAALHITAGPGHPGGPEEWIGLRALCSRLLDAEERDRFFLGLTRVVVTPLPPAAW